MASNLTPVDRAALYGWAFSPNATELSEAIGKRYSEIAGREDFVITSSFDPTDYNSRTYRGLAPADFSDGDIAIRCDSGNCAFGARVERQGTTFKCKISTD